MICVALLFSTAALKAPKSDGMKELIFTAQWQTGLFKPGDDVGALNPHVYRPEEFAVNDLVYEGLTAWDNTSPGVDGVFDTDDDFVTGALATSWVTNYDAVKADPALPYWIKFSLRKGVTFHDGQPWNAAAAVANFNHVVGTAARARKGFHDWYGLVFAMSSWEEVSEYEFKVTFSHYYSAAERELSQIRPFRMISPMQLPDIDSEGLSCTETFKNWGSYKCVGIKAPYGTGPYKIAAKRLANAATGASRLLPAQNFSAVCGVRDKARFTVCEYGPNETVSELIFEKFADYTPTPTIVMPTFDKAIMRAYPDHGAVKAALEDGSLDMAYGLSTLSPSGFQSLAAREKSQLSTHVADHDLNTRFIGMHSGSPALGTASLRKMAMCVMDRTMLYEGDLSEEMPSETLFDPTLPLMREAAPQLMSIAALCESSTNTPADVNATLRFLYPTGQAHIKAIVYNFIALFSIVGIRVTPMPKSKDEYNAELGKWTGPNGGTGVGYYGDDLTPRNNDTINWVGWDLAYSESWGPGYDALTSLNDIGYNWPAEVWSEAPNYLDSITKKELNAKISGIAKIVGEAERHAAFTEVMTILNDEAIFLPLTAKRNLAVTSNRLAGFHFSGMEFSTGSVVAGLTLAPSAEDAWQTTAREAGWVPCPQKAAAARRRMSAQSSLLFSRDEDD